MALLPSTRPFFESGFRLHSGDALNKILGSIFGFVSSGNGVDTAFGKNSLIMSGNNAVTAHAGGTQAAATLLTADINYVTVCATTGDSVALPLGVAGMDIIVSNHGAGTLDVYVANGSTDTINAVATGTAFTITTGLTAEFFCAGPNASGVGLWAAQAAS